MLAITVIFCTTIRVLAIVLIYKMLYISVYFQRDTSTMGKLRSFYVELLDPQQVYFAGQTINGRLVVELDGEMKMRGFKQ